jgi:bacterioferritin
MRLAMASSVQRVVPEAMLNEVLATELVCVLRYRRYSRVGKRSLTDRDKRRFLHHAQVRQEQADRIAERIVQLGGSPQVDPSDLATRSRSGCAMETHLQDLLRDDLQFERTANQTYGDMLRYFKTHDVTTARLLVWILATQEKHMEGLELLLMALVPAPR